MPAARFQTEPDLVPERTKRVRAPVEPPAARAPVLQPRGVESVQSRRAQRQAELRKLRLSTLPVQSAPRRDCWLEVAQACAEMAQTQHRSDHCRAHLGSRCRQAALRHAHDAHAVCGLDLPHAALEHPRAVAGRDVRRARPLRALASFLSFGSILSLRAFGSLRRFCAGFGRTFSPRGISTARGSLGRSRSLFRPALPLGRTVLASALIAASFLTAPLIVPAFLASTAATIAVAISARSFALRTPCFARLDLDRLGRSLRLACQPAEDLLQDRGSGASTGCTGIGAGCSGVMPWTAACGRAGFGSALGSAGFLGFRRLLDQLIAGRQRLHLVQVVVAQALDRVVRRLEMDVRHQQHVDLDARLDRVNLGALLVQQEGRDVDRHLRDAPRAVFSFIASSCRMRRMCSAVDSVPRMWPVPWQRGQVMCAGLAERRAQPLARQLHQAEARDLADLHARAVVAQRVAQAVLDLALVALRSPCR